jgi:hypothetical protein
MLVDTTQTVPCSALRRNRKALHRRVAAQDTAHDPLFRSGDFARDQEHAQE